MRVQGIPYVQGRNDYRDWDGRKFGIAIHNTSNDASDEGEASYASRRTDGVSAHLYVDDDSVTQSLDLDDRAGHAGSSEGNDHSIAVEITGANGKSRSWWLRNVAWDKLGQVLAWIITHDPDYEGFQVRRATVAEMRRNPRVKAFYSHDDMRRAWGGTTHTDPGPNFPWDRLLKAVNEHLEGDMAMSDDDVKRTWLRDGLLPAPESGLKKWPDNKTWAAWSAIQMLVDAARPHVTQQWDDIWPGEGPITTVGVAARRAAIEAARSRRGVDQLAGRLAAVEAVILGTDVTAAVRAELDAAAERELVERAAERTELLDSLSEDLAERIAGRLTQVPTDEVRAAVREELSRTRLAVGQPDGS